MDQLQIGGEERHRQPTADRVAHPLDPYPIDRRGLLLLGGLEFGCDAGDLRSARFCGPHAHAQLESTVAVASHFGIPTAAKRPEQNRVVQQLKEVGFPLPVPAQKRGAGLGEDEVQIGQIPEPSRDDSFGPHHPEI